MSNNPLLSAYRKPALYIQLPSGGKFYEPKPKLSVDGELAIYPMTARDELITKTPDALFNGEATNALIQSCAPDIADPDQIPVNDLLTILLAIRQASYGDQIEVDVTCPSCSHINQMAFDANAIINTADRLEDKDTQTIVTGEFVVDLKPYSLRDRTLLQIQQVKQTKMIQALSQSSSMTEEEQTAHFGKTFIEIANLTIELISNCILRVSHETELETPVTDKEHIREWLSSITRKDYDQIKEVVENLSESGINELFKIKCQECGHAWDSQVDLDMSNFFAG